MRDTIAVALFLAVDDSSRPYNFFPQVEPQDQKFCQQFPPALQWFYTCEEKTSVKSLSY